MGWLIFLGIGTIAYLAGRGAGKSSVKPAGSSSVQGPDAIPPVPGGPPPP